MQTVMESSWGDYLLRYQGGEERSVVFRDLVLADIRQLGKTHPPVVMDIGCGGGFDSITELQRSISQAAGRYIGVEPDTEIELDESFSTVHRGLFEDVPIEPDSVDVAFSVMVLEHIADPEAFWGKLHRVLRPGGVFWGFTIDARHWFVSMSMLTEKLHIKDIYLNLLHGRRGEERYENYGVYYRSNTPRQIAEQTRAFASSEVLNFHRDDQLDYYFPKSLQGLSRAYERYGIRKGKPGCVLAVRVQK